jgi:hypothetical protein
VYVVGVAAGRDTIIFSHFDDLFDNVRKQTRWEPPFEEILHDIDTNGFQTVCGGYR